MRSGVRMVLVVGAIVLGLAPPAAADGPGVGTPTVVTLGDSAISGEGGRWAGNTNQSSSRVDALGSRAYWDTADRRGDPRLPPLEGGAAQIGGGVASLNLACSGAKTTTGGTGSGQDFKPGIDFYSDSPAARARRSRCRTTRRRTTSRRSSLMIGANNYGFAAIVERCVTNWLTSPSWWKNYCSDDSDMTSRFTAARQATETTNVSEALQRVAPGDDQRRLHRDRSTRSSPRPTGRRSRAAAASATRRAAGRASRSAAAAPGTATPTGPTTPSCRAMNNTRQERRGARPACPTSVTLDLVRTRSSAGGCARTRRRAARGDGRRELAERGRGRPDASGSRRSGR